MRKISLIKKFTYLSAQIKIKEIEEGLCCDTRTIPRGLVGSDLSCRLCLNKKPTWSGEAGRDGRKRGTSSRRWPRSGGGRPPGCRTRCTLPSAQRSCPRARHLHRHLSGKLWSFTAFFLKCRLVQALRYHMRAPNPPRVRLSVTGRQNFTVQFTVQYFRRKVRRSSIAFSYCRHYLMKWISICPVQPKLRTRI